MIEIKAAANEDLPRLLLLIEQLGYPLELEIFKQRFEIFIKQEGYGVVCAEQKGIVIGFVAWSKSFLFVAPKTRFHVEGIVIDDEYRGQGIGKKLMNYVENYAKDFSPCIIDLTSGLRREKEGVHEFYKSLGYQNEGHMAKLYLRKEL